MKRIASIVFSVCVLLGCATTSDAPSYATAPVPEPNPDRAILYIYRVSAAPLALSAYLDIDDRRAVSLANQGFTWVYLAPGDHRFAFGWPVFSGTPTVRFVRNMEAGKTYAFEMKALRPRLQYRRPRR